MTSDQLAGPRRPQGNRGGRGTRAGAGTPTRNVADDERRLWVGRRFEDLLLNGILIELSPAERGWRLLVNDPRYRPLIDRRGPARRDEDFPPFGRLESGYHSESALKWLAAEAGETD